MFAIRPYHLSDLTALYRICVCTAAAGGDASALSSDHDLLGHLYVAPYVLYGAAHSFVLTHDDVPVGYLAGVRDLTAFLAVCERDWWPTLRARYPLPDASDTSHDAQSIRHIHTVRTPFPERAQYGANMHINLLPVAQGQGWGARLINTFLDSLRAHDVKGVSLGVSAANARAIAFYERFGFHRIPGERSSIGFGLWL
jgi:ribosomal protein S18 acetylase RimI-like enzyme